MVDKDMRETQQPQKPLSLREQLAGMRSPAASIVRAVEVFAEADEALTEVRTLFELVRQGDELGIAYLAATPNIGRRGAVREWFRLWLEKKEGDKGPNLQDAWDYWFGKISILAQEGDQRVAPLAQWIVNTILIASKNAFLFSQFRQALFTFERPCRIIRRPEQLTTYLELLAEQGFAERTRLSPRGKAIRWGEYYYVPKRNLRAAYIGWQFVVSAVGRIRSIDLRQEAFLKRLGPLLDLTNLPLEPEEGWLTKLVKDTENTGTMAIWDPASRARGENMGLLAIVVGRWVKEMPLLIVDSMADKPLPQSMRGLDGYDLPPYSTEIRDDGSLNIKFQISGVSGEERQALWRLERLFQWRLRLEGRKTQEQPMLAPGTPGPEAQ